MNSFWAFVTTLLRSFQSAVSEPNETAAVEETPGSPLAKLSTVYGALTPTTSFNDVLSTINRTPLSTN